MAVRSGLNRVHVDSGEVKKEPKCSIRRFISIANSCYRKQLVRCMARIHRTCPKSTDRFMLVVTSAVVPSRPR
jgi:hypothetical protein